MSKTRAIRLALLISLLTASPSLAKRLAPTPVQPVFKNGVEYSAPNNDGRNAYVIATDEKTEKVLWKVKVFHTRMKPLLEEDVQWVFITRLEISGNSILVRDEKFRCYRIDLSTHAVRGGHWFSCW